jgi:hypothetical protein
VPQLPDSVQLRHNDIKVVSLQKRQMKNKLLVGLIVLSISGFGQTSEKKNNISVGLGTNAYNGDLGNPWFNPKDEWYGVGSLNYGRYLNRSFDISLALTSGDYGHCRDEDDERFRPDGSEVLNMLSRLTTGVIAVKYKFTNGYILNENAKIGPYIYLGGGINNISEYWWANKTRANTGNYGSYNGGLGVRYNVCSHLNVTYNLGFGYFTTDNIDKRAEGTKDMYMQNTILFGVNF